MAKIPIIFETANLFLYFIFSAIPGYGWLFSQFLQSFPELYLALLTIFCGLKILGSNGSIVCYVLLLAIISHMCRRR